MNWPWKKHNDWSFKPRCSKCFIMRAARIRLVAPTTSPEDTPKQVRFIYSGPGGSNGQGDLIPIEEAERIKAAFAKPYDGVRIRLADFYDDAGFCLECSRFYCWWHWGASADGAGECPKGHFKSLDPHWSPDFDFDE
ncbi:MAG TPA: hypothetical protein VFS90_11645 [Pyrinomonadaceae bacterium]|nr:hypothetical protein [Pyrinomonadaceae bacterium]